MPRPLILVAAVALWASPGITHAAFTITLQQVGSNVAATGSGTINTSALTLEITNSGSAGLITSSIADLLVGPATTNPGDFWHGFTGPNNFGTGSTEVFATSGSGNIAGIFGTSYLVVPNGYVSGASLSDTATWSGQTLSSLGVTPGSYSWSWGSGATADSLTLNATAAPEPGSLALLGLGGLGLLLARRKRLSAL